MNHLFSFLFRSANTLLLFGFLLYAGSLMAQSGSKTNVIIIYCDDLGYGDLGVYGHPTIATPNLDKMAQEGLKFNQFYVGASVCTPSRAALLTGRLPIRSGMVSSEIRVLFPFSKSGLPDTEITMAEALRSQGYKTGMVGKWHLGHLEPFLPLQHGFDEYFGVPYSNDMRPNPNSKGASLHYPPLPLVEGNQTIETGIDQRILTKRYTRRALTFIEENQDAPFFLYFAQSFPHIPLYASEDFEGKSRRGLYGDVVEELDWSVGEVLNKVRELGLEENTLVFFTSDNGPWLVMKEEGGSAGLLREGKGSTWEGGMREPAIAWWPGTIEGGKSTQHIATTMDLYATALDLAGYSLPDDWVIDGHSMLPIMLEDKSIGDEVLYYWGAEIYAVRKGPWKMHYKTITPYVGEAAVAHDPPLLFNLETDPSELYNVADKYPSVIPQLQHVVEEHRNSFSPPPSRLEIVDSDLISGKKAYK